jgi:hypothetical protein
MDLNNFVMPQFPEIGWDAVPDQVIPDQNVEMPDQMDQVVVHQAQESIVLNPSDNSGSSVNMVHEAALVPMADQFNLNLQVGAMQFGPDLPPDLLWKRWFERMLPEILAKNVPLSVILPPFLLAKRSWNIAFDLGEKFSFFSQPSEPSNRKVILVKKSVVARVLDFQQEGEEREIREGHMFSVTPVTVKKKRARRGKTPVVQPATRHFTRSCLNSDGYRPKPICVDQPRPKKRPRAKLLLVQQVEQADDEPMEEQGKNVQEEAIVKPTENKESEFEEMEFPPTPIHVM